MNRNCVIPFNNSSSYADSSRLPGFVVGPLHPHNQQIIFFHLLYTLASQGASARVSVRTATSWPASMGGSVELTVLILLEGGACKIIGYKSTGK